MSCKVSLIDLGFMSYPVDGYISKAEHGVTLYHPIKNSKKL